MNDRSEEGLHFLQRVREIRRRILQVLVEPQVALSPRLRPFLLKLLLEVGPDEWVGVEGIRFFSRQKQPSLAKPNESLAPG
jgi:hypothetical protein